ncbi:MAG: prolyl oligopeptidase family serine peptidase [Planctomycetota bacterium]|nr:prolyl oligopeptidase family serine peptidase [Planctomycetota bacterium]MDA1137104.1 prolyl oligopeptidase family serine peptidase [Planctomycetota bacterium]
MTNFRGQAVLLWAFAGALPFQAILAQAAREQVIENFGIGQKIVADMAAKRVGLPEDRKALFDHLYPLAKLKLDQAMLHLDDDEVYPTKALKKSLMAMARRFSSRTDYGKAKLLLAEVARLSEFFDANRDPLADSKGSIIERAYIAENDDSAQPYYVYVPKKYEKEKKWPLFIFLHGWVPETSKIDPWLCPSDVLPIADELEFLYLQPHGRRNTDFQFVGEIDVLESIRQTQKYYSIDPERIYLIGASMGGGGVWTIGVHQPHEFAAIGPINGQIDWFRFWQDLFRYPDKEQLPRHQQWMMGYNNPIDLCGSLRALPTFMQHALGDHINKVQYAREIYAKLKGFDCPADVFYDEDSLGHFIYFKPAVYRRAFENLLKYRRNNAPKVVQHHTFSLRYPRAHWVTLDSFEAWGSMAKITAEVKDASIDVKTENVGAFHLDLPVALIEGNKVKVISDGKVVHDGPIPADRRIQVGTKPTGRAKSTTVSGPIPEAFNFPFMVVRGTTGSEARKQQVTGNVEKFLTDWWAYAEGLPPTKDDSQINEADIRDRNLILFGEPDTNSVLNRIADKLPIKITESSYVVAQGKYQRTSDTGLAMIYPNPLNENKYVVVLSGLHWGEKRGSNHKYDLLPDFIVYNNEFDQAVSTNHALVAGFFDTEWQLSARLTWSD